MTGKKSYDRIDLICFGHLKNIWSMADK